MGSSSKEETETQPVVAHRLPTTTDSSPKASVFAITDSVGEILQGIRCYFDKALPVLLLYKDNTKKRSWMMFHLQLFMAPSICFVSLVKSQ
ncbi:hypothetical protein DY000_02009328 [Brassica cretica]|uniref:Uncharacterized protein n=1 Tax=Brassica cretica TaxID=69181 RepID=A0ABQ7CIY6_BRACR|nr:hypothetical protein DY000_02009328 [Brassica cretica]